MSMHRTSGPDGPNPDTVTTRPPGSADIADFRACKAANAGTSPAAPTSAISNDDLLRFVDGALEDDGRVRVLTYLAARPAAVERVEAYLQQNARLKGLREALPLTDSRDFAAPLQAAIVARQVRNRRLRSWRRIAVAASVTLLLAVSATGIALDHRSATTHHVAGEPTAPQAVFLFGSSELGTTIDPAAAAAEPPVLDLATFSWLADRAVDVSVTAPDLQRVGLSLIDGDVIDRNGSPAIRAVYQDADGKPVVLFAGVGKPDVRHAFWLEREGYVSLQWRRGAMIFALVAPTGSPQLSAIVELVGAAVASIPLPETAANAVPEVPHPAPAPVADPVPVQATPAEPTTTEAGPVQSIAVPLVNTTEAPVDPTALANPETIHPDNLVDPAAGNEPKPL
jgi:anti-sigma factor RsiW